MSPDDLRPLRAPIPTEAWVLVGLPELQLELGRMAAQHPLLALRLASGQVLHGERSPEALEQTLAQALERVAGPVRIFAAESLPRLQRDIQRALDFIDKGAEALRVLLYRHDRHPASLQALLRLPEVAARHAPWLQARELGLPHHADERVLALRPPSPMVPQGCDAAAYRSAWQAAFEEWAQARLAPYDLMNPDAQDWLLDLYGAEPGALEALQDQPELGDEPAVPPHLSTRQQDLQTFAFYAGDPTALAASSGPDRPPYMRSAPGVFKLSGYPPVGPHLSLQLTWQEAGTRPMLVELHPRDALPLLIQPVAEAADLANPAVVSTWRLQYQAGSDAQAEQLWRGLLDEGEVHVHREDL